MDARWENRLHCTTENPLPLPNFYVRPKHILSATSAQICRFHWSMPSLGVRSPYNILCEPPFCLVYVERSLHKMHFILGSPSQNNNVMGIESFNFCYPFIQNILQNWLFSMIRSKIRSFEWKGSKKCHLRPPWLHPTTLLKGRNFLTKVLVLLDWDFKQLKL